MRVLIPAIALALSSLVSPAQAQTTCEQNCYDRCLPIKPFGLELFIKCYDDCVAAFCNASASQTSVVAATLLRISEETAVPSTQSMIASDACEPEGGDIPLREEARVEA